MFKSRLIGARSRLLEPWILNIIDVVDIESNLFRCNLLLYFSIRGKYFIRQSNETNLCLSNFYILYRYLKLF